MGIEETVIPFEIEELDEEIETSKTYALDLERGCIVGMIDGIDAVRQFIRKSIMTPRFKCLIYDNDFGSEINETIRCNDASESYIEAEIPRLIWDAIGFDDRIISASDYEYNFDYGKDEAHMKFTVETIFGTTDVEEVIT